MSLAAADSIRALDGFFAWREPVVALGAAAAVTPSLFVNFELATNSWDELERKRQHAESAVTVEVTDDGDANASASSATASSPNSRRAAKQVKIVYFVRHAEGYHNVAERELGTERWEAVEAKQEQFLDADLTPFGIQDTESKGPPAVAAEQARGMPRVGRVVVSTLSRAIQTAQHFFLPEQAPRPFVAIELARETLGVHTCDKRRPLSELTAKFPDVDFSRILDEPDAMWTPTHRETDEELRVRARVFLSQLFRDVRESHVAVVTHSGFMTAVWSLFHSHRYKPANCEVIPLALEWSDASQAAGEAAAEAVAVVE